MLSFVLFFFVQFCSIILLNKGENYAAGAKGDKAETLPLWKYSTLHVLAFLKLRPFESIVLIIKQQSLNTLKQNS